MFGGQIQGYQILHHAPRTSRKILARLKEERKVVEHRLVIGNKQYNMYTLGPVGALKINARYHQDYWMYYSDSETIQKLMAVDLYIRMEDFLSAELKIYAADSPYLYTFLHGDKEYQIGVIWDNIESFIELYRWRLPQERVILMCQSVNMVNDLAKYLTDDVPIRIIGRDTVKQDLIFHRLEHGKWVLDIPDKIIKTKKDNLKVVRDQKVLLP